MKNLKKISREQLKDVMGGILSGMIRCISPISCTRTVGYIGGLDNPCGITTYTICRLEE
jgi:hypothetical protein